MLKQLSLGLMALVAAGTVMASGITSNDAGIYDVVTMQNNKPTGLSGIQMRLYQKSGDWFMDGRDSNIKGPNQNKWMSVCSAQSKCDFRASSKKQLQTIFPNLATMQKTDEVGCIQNEVQAICRLDSKVQKGYVAYMTVALRTNPPTYMFLQRQK